MDRKKFRLHYLLSLVGAELLGMLLIIIAVFMIFMNGLKEGISTDTFTSVVGNSALILLGVFIMVVGMIWNLVISFLRSKTQNNNLKLFWVVLGGWIVQFIIPLLGLLIGMGLQIWAWYLGSEADNS